MGGKVAVTALLSSLMLAIVMIGTARAHELRPSVMDVVVNADSVEMVLDVVIEPFVAGIDQSAVFDTNDAPQAARHDALRASTPDVLEATIATEWERIGAGFVVESDGQRVPLELVEASVPEVGDIELPRDTQLVVRGNLPAGTAPVTVGWRAEYGSLIVRQGEGETAYSVLLSNGDISAPLPRDAIAVESTGETFVRYLISGFDHIIPKGLDHILFVLGLFFFSLRWRPLLAQVTAFTVAHTTTLALAVLGHVSLPGSIVEPLIAISIVYVAVENIFFGGPDAKIGMRRIALVFAFGLLHGLGFASVLEEFGLGSALVTALIAFNIGVEVGQLAVIALAFVLLALPFGRKPWFRSVIAIPISVFIAIIGAWWAFERVFL